MICNIYSAVRFAHPIGIVGAALVLLWFLVISRLGLSVPDLHVLRSALCLCRQLAGAGHATAEGGLTC